VDYWWLYLAIGAVAGFMAGLLGVGGGMLLVPILLFVFGAKPPEAGFPPEHLMHMALATAMATIPFTSLASVGAHHLRGGVDWKIVKGMLPGLLLGAVAAALVAGKVPGRPLAIFFAAFIFYNVPLKRAVGTAAAIGFPLAVAASVGYVLAGLQAGPLPAWSLGFIYVPALALIAVPSVLLAPVGARVSQRMPVKQLRIVFALLLYFIAIRMVISLW
jgi:uncharacterized membrane protein YfcA